MENYFTIQQIKDANCAIGNHWFDNSTLRFFRSRSSGPVIANMFVSSERFLDAPNSANRRYTIRRCDAGRIETVSNSSSTAPNRPRSRLSAHLQKPSPHQWRATLGAPSSPRTRGNTMYREFRIKTLINNRDEYAKTVQLLVTDDNLTPLVKIARQYAKDHGIAQLSPFVSIPMNPGYRGIWLQSLNTKNTGVIISEIFA